MYFYTFELYGQHAFMYIISFLGLSAAVPCHVDSSVTGGSADTTISVFLGFLECMACGLVMFVRSKI